MMLNDAYATHTHKRSKIKITDCRDIKYVAFRINVQTNLKPGGSTKLKGPRVAGCCCVMAQVF